MRAWTRICMSLAFALAIFCCSISFSAAQSNEGAKLHKEVGALLSAGKYEQASPVAQRELAIYEKAIEADHPPVVTVLDFATALGDLALSYLHQGRYAEAEPLFKRALAIYEERAVGRNLSLVAAGLNNLAQLYKAEGRYAEAEPLYKRAQAIDEKALGPDHPDVATDLNNRADLYELEGRYADAEPLEQRALAINEKALGPDHPYVGAALAGLAYSYLYQGRYADAEPLFKRSLAIAEKTLGPDHPFVAIALNNLAVVYLDERRYADAEPLYQRALAIEEKLPRPEFSILTRSLTGLAYTYLDQGRYADAEPIFKRSLAVAEKGLGPDHPDTEEALSNLATLYSDQERYAEAEPLYKRALAIAEKALAPNSPDVARNASGLLGIYESQKRYADALPLIQMTVSHLAGSTGSALPILFDAQTAGLIGADETIDDGLNVVQHALQTSAGKALNALAVRFAAGNDPLAQLVRKDQDLAGQATALNKTLVVALGKSPSPSNTSTEQQVRDRIAAVSKQRDDVAKVLAREFPDYVALSNPQPLTVKEIQSLLAGDEALVVIDLRWRHGSTGQPIPGTKSYVWAITRDTAEWKELDVSDDDISKVVAALRAQLDFYNIKPFDPQPAFQLYQKVLAPVADVLKGKPRLSFVIHGTLTSLPPQLLVTRDPTGKALKDVAWLIRSHSITVLPSIESLKVLRGKSVTSSAPKPLIGFADPVFSSNQLQLAQNTSVVSDVTAARGIRGTVANLAELEKALPPLPDTATELREVAASVHADPADIILGGGATVTRVKQERLDQFRIVYFATHGLLAGDVAQFQKLSAEPALVLSLPAHPTQFDDGLLTASEVAQLKLNADWVVLSACNTAAGEKPGAEALSGLARAFFYAGARSLVVSNWEVDSKSAAQLMIGTFAALAANPKLSHAQALQKSMLAMINNAQHPEWVDPKYWAPFVVVGEPPKPGT
jgi:CHAT domain-containing protein/Tfp pilus assembly protein PilF